MNARPLAPGLQYIRRSIIGLHRLPADEAPAFKIVSRRGRQKNPVRSERALCHIRARGTVAFLLALASMRPHGCIDTFGLFAAYFGWAD